MEIGRCLGVWGCETLKDYSWIGDEISPFFKLSFKVKIFFIELERIFLGFGQQFLANASGEGKLRSYSFEFLFFSTNFSIEFS